MKEPVQVTIPILVLPTPSVLFPSTAIRINLPPDEKDLLNKSIGLGKYKKLKRLIDLKSEKDIIIGVLPRNIDNNGVHNMGTIARVVTRSPALRNQNTTSNEETNKSYSPSDSSIILQGLTRFRVVYGDITTTDTDSCDSCDSDENKNNEAYKSARVLVYDSGYQDKLVKHDKEIQDKMEQLKQVVRKMIQPWGASGLSAMQRFLTFAQGILAPGMLVDIFSSVLPLSYSDRIALLDAVDVRSRLDLAIVSIEKSAELIIAAHNKRNQDSSASPSSSSTSSSESAIALTKKQREVILRQQLKAIQDKLDELERSGGDQNDPSSSREVGFPIGPHRGPPTGSGSSGTKGPFDDNLDEEDDEDGLIKLQETLLQLDLPEDGRKIVNRELKRLKRMNVNQAEYQVCRTYLENIAELPWNKLDNDKLDLSVISKAREIFDADHYGLEKVKKRLLEYLAVVYLKQRSSVLSELQKNHTESSKEVVAAGSPSPVVQAVQDKAPILLLVGPPGVGKTSLAKSVAHALNRKLHRISLGGVRDEAEIRGHRRTYVGAMPGILAQALRKVGVMNPVIVLDEIDKLSQGNTGTNGDPSAAMLEVLDPEQNYSFTDRYINFPLDLSQVLFIATANTTETIPRALLDRMETIYIGGYTYLEKQHIAENYLIPKQLKYNGLAEDQLIIPSEVIDRIATRYTREAGVRNLERELGTLCRGKAVEQLESAAESKETSSSESPQPSSPSSTTGAIVTLKELPRYLGLEKFQDDVVNDEVDEYIEKGKIIHRHTPGLVNGLAYMGSGNGGLLVFEATAMPSGSGKLKLTGQLGEVISESAQIALSWVRANAVRLGLPSDVLKNVDIHLHAPAGAIPKDGPSAGVAMTLTFVSLLCNKEVPRDIAMTGEITLRGKILAVGGIREKLLGAHLAGIRKVILPYHCAKTVHDECGFLKDIDMEVVYVKYIWDVFNQVWPESKLVVDSHL